MLHAIQNYKRFMAGLSLAAIMTVAVAAPAFAAPAFAATTGMEVGITAGSRTVEISALTFEDAALDYSLSAQTVTTVGTTGAPSVLAVSDLTGSGAAWTVSAQSTVLTSGTDTIPNTAIAVTPTLTSTDDAATIGAGGALGTEQVVLQAAADAGDGTHIADLDIEITVPGSQVPGTYSGTLTVTETPIV